MISHNSVCGKMCVSETMCPSEKMAASMPHPSTCAFEMNRDANGQLSPGITDPIGLNPVFIGGASYKTAVC